MKINSIDQSNMQAGMTRGTDSAMKNIQTQIANAKKQLQDVSDNRELNESDKAKKSQELERKIEELNRELKQRQLEQEKEKEETKSVPAENAVAETKKEETREEYTKTEEKQELRQEKAEELKVQEKKMRDIISAEAVMQQSNARSRAVEKLEREVDVLDAEINQNEIRGVDVEAKQEMKEELKEIIIHPVMPKTDEFQEVDQAIGKVVIRK